MPSILSHPLSQYYEIVTATILSNQDPVTGLLSMSGHAWVRDNVYSITVVWALAMAYRRIRVEEDQVRIYLLEQATVKCMRGLLMAMMGQREKVERFKTSFSSRDALHAKYSSVTGKVVVGDNDWGHLQIDATALFLLMLAQMTASGLQIIYTLDEVAFVQNLVFYIECAYVIPDYGMWERGDKSNQSIMELNSSSVGMAKAALEALDKLDLFGGQGSPASVVHVLPDETLKCAAVLESMLPRESNSKETDASILSIIGFPAFAVRNDQQVVDTLDTLQAKLRGKYGMKRFLRDGYQTSRENPDRLHYETWELRQFDNIECEWPLFFCYLLINYAFNGQYEKVQEISDILEGLVVEKGGIKMLPQLYKVAEKDVIIESCNPGKCKRIDGGRVPFMWAQSLFLVGKLLKEGLVAPGELDPLNRRLYYVQKPAVVVQVVVLAEDSVVQNMLAQEGISVQTTKQISPIRVQPARMLSNLYTFLGRSTKLGLSGRRSLDVGILATSRVYKIQGKTFLFTPQSFDRSTYYTDTDPCLAMSTLWLGLNYLSKNWSELSRPLVTIILSKDMFQSNTSEQKPIVNTVRKLASGYIYGTRIALGTHEELAPTSTFTELAFLGNIEDGKPDKLDPEVSQFLEKYLGEGNVVSEGVLGTKASPEKERKVCARKNGVEGAMKRTRSIIYTSEESREIATVLKEEKAKLEASIPIPVPAVITLTTDGNNFQKSPRTRSDSSVYRSQEVEELVVVLMETNDMIEQGDILQHMVETYGMNYYTKLGTVKKLVMELYDKACQVKYWSIVRHTSGLLGKKIPNLALSLTDLIVRQKQVTVGPPAIKEVIISRPLGAKELMEQIKSAYQGDSSSFALTQEILTYLALFIKTEPNLFHGMTRLRVGLIIQVMTSEIGNSIIAKSMGIDTNEAMDWLLNMSPYDTKTLLHNILSGQEYGVKKEGCKCSIISLPSWISSIKENDEIASHLSADPVDCSHTSLTEDSRAGIWLRRRLLEGSLNRVPQGFYTQVWSVLERCQGISVGGQILHNSLIQEMTSGEMKFHLKCEAMLYTVQEPRLRQLMVEAIMVLINVVEHNVVPHLGEIINVLDIVRQANYLFLIDQESDGGAATQCCLSADKTMSCSGGMCNLFYDSAPSGPYGTMSYLVKAVCNIIDTIPEDGDIDCSMM